MVGFLSSWGEVGRYGAPHRMVTALLTFGLILQQAAFPTLSRLWRQTACAGREALDSLVEVLMTGWCRWPSGCTMLADPWSIWCFRRIMRGPGCCWHWAFGGRPC